MLGLIKKTGFLTRTLLNNKNVFFFSKDAKPAKGGDKGGAPAAPAAPVITEPTLE